MNKNNHCSVGSYRSDIDGLRAISVLSVILFHLHISGFTGGYVGVDIFFVISGYLITKQIFDEMQRGEFSVNNFYLRRIRRIVPALLLMLIFVLIFSYFLLKPEEIRSFALSLAVQPFSLQNFMFLSEGEYFLGSDLKPLLHTWSLAVEEQFYFFWPLALLLMRARSFVVLLIFLFAVIVGSFCVNIVLMGVSPKASFFMLPARAWELAVGGGVALFETRKYFLAMLTDRVKFFSGVAGFVFILFSVFYFTPETKFPGWAAIVPVAGAALVIVAGVNTSSFIGKVLSVRPLVVVGLISYPLYLWHWPIIALLKQMGIYPDSFAVIFIMLGVMFAASFATYWFIERPIRSKKFLSQPRTLLLATLAGFLVLFASGVFIYSTKGASYRYSSVASKFLTAPIDARTQRCGTIFKLFNPKTSVCSMVDPEKSTKKVLLWGNSHADHWSALFEDLAKAHGAGFYLNARNCRALPDSDFCGTGLQESIFRFIDEKAVTDVVLSSTWYGSYGINDQVFEKNLDQLAASLSKRDLRVWLVIDVPSADALSPVIAYSSNPLNPKIGSIPLSEYNPVKIREQLIFEKLAAKYPDIRVVDPSRSLCDAQRCFGGNSQEIWYRDRGHLSDAGARAVKEQFQPIFAN